LTEPPSQPACEFEHHEGGCRGRDRGGDTCGQGRADGPGYEQGSDGDGCALAERPLVDEGVDELPGRPSSVGCGRPLEPFGDPVRVTVGQPVRGDGDSGRGDDARVGLGSWVFGGDDEAGGDGAVDGVARVVLRFDPREEPVGPGHVRRTLAKTSQASRVFAVRLSTM
jgi:hypothetical protein